MGIRLNLCRIQRNKHTIRSILKIFFHQTAYLSGENPGENVKKCLLIPYHEEGLKKRRKVSIIGGAGCTGSVMAYTLLLKNYVDEIVMVDIPKVKNKLCAEAFDLIHGTSMHKCPKIKICLDLKKTTDSDFVIFNSGNNNLKHKTRLDLAKDNIKHFAEVVPKVAKLSPDCVMLVVTNPTDLMTYAAWKYSGFEKNRVIGSGTELDSSRFRYHISRRLGMNPYNVKGWVIGEHGESSVPAWSSVNVAGTKLRDLDPTIGTKNDKNCWNELHKLVVRDGPMVHEMKGSTNFGISQVCNNITRAVLCNCRTIHSVSVCLQGIYGIETECFLSFPCILGNRGVSEIVQICLEDDEIEALAKSAAALDKHMKSIKFPKP